MRNQLSGTVMGGPLVPRAAVEAIDRYQNEQRSADYVLLDHAAAGDVPAPTPEELAQYFDQRKILFRAPEYRKLQVLTLIPSDQANWIEVSDADIKRAYEDRRGSFGTPERRQATLAASSEKSRPTTRKAVRAPARCRSIWRNSPPPQPTSSPTSSPTEPPTSTPKPRKPPCPASTQASTTAPTSQSA